MALPYFHAFILFPDATIYIRYAAAAVRRRLFALASIYADAAPLFYISRHAPFCFH